MNPLMHHYRGSQPGFTLVELLVSLTLSSLLLMVTLGVAGGMSKGILAVESVPYPRWQRALSERVTPDISTARFFYHSPQNLILTGHGGTRSQDLFPTLRPAQIQYRVVPMEGRNWLIREEQDLSDGTPRVWREILAEGIYDITILRQESEKISSGKLSEIQAIGFVGDDPQNSVIFYLAE